MINIYEFIKVICSYLYTILYKLDPRSGCWVMTFFSKLQVAKLSLITKLVYLITC